MKKNRQIQFAIIIFLILSIVCEQSVQTTTFQEQIRNGNFHGEILEEKNYTYMKESYKGKLSNKQQKEIMEKWVTLFSGDMVAEWEIEGMKNYYVTTKKLRNGIRVGKERINLNITFSYNEQVEQTICYVATPILNLDY